MQLQIVPSSIWWTTLISALISLHLTVIIQYCGCSFTVSLAVKNKHIVLHMWRTRWIHPRFKLQPCTKLLSRPSFCFIFLRKWEIAAAILLKCANTNGNAVYKAKTVFSVSLKVSIWYDYHYSQSELPQASFLIIYLTSSQE